MKPMPWLGLIYDCSWLIVCATVLSLLKAANGVDIFLEWHIAVDTTIKPVSMDQPVINDTVTSFSKPHEKGLLESVVALFRFFES